MKVLLTGYKTDFPIIPVNGYVEMTKPQLSVADNYSEVDFTGVSHIVINRDISGHFRIVQTTGFKKPSGKFTTLYKSVPVKKGVQYDV